MKGSIVKRYAEVLNKLKKNNSEENKQNFLIIFNELDLQLNNELKKEVEDSKVKGKTLDEEINRVNNILSSINIREKNHKIMYDNYVKYIGYKPKNMRKIPFEKDKDEYMEYVSNLTLGNDSINKLLDYEYELKKLEKKGARKIKIKNTIEARDKKLKELKRSKKVLESLYKYIIDAPYDEKNAYISFILIKYKKGKNE